MPRWLQEICCPQLEGELNFFFNLFLNLFQGLSTFTQRLSGNSNFLKETIWRQHKPSLKTKLSYGFFLSIRGKRLGLHHWDSIFWLLAVGQLEFCKIKTTNYLFFLQNIFLGIGSSDDAEQNFFRWNRPHRFVENKKNHRWTSQTIEH